MLGWSPLVPLSVVVLGGIYAAQLLAGDVQLDDSAAVVAAGLLVTAELAYWSIDEREPVESSRGLDLRRLVVVAGLGVSSLLVAEVLLVVSDLVRARGLALDYLGAVAAAGVLIAVAALARRGPSS